ncbi:putative multidrug resistance protein [Fagus crenata]
MEYLKAVLRQEVGYFYNNAASSTSFQVVSTISFDAHIIQDTIAEKIPNCLTHLTAFVFNLIVAFVLSGRLALAVFQLSLMFIVPRVGFGKVLKGLGTKMKDAYGIAGSITEQAISSIRTTYLYVGERQTLDRFSYALQKSMDLGIKQGLTKGLLIGSMGMIYAVWAFQAWVGSVLVIERREKGGIVFIAGVYIIVAGVSIMNALPNLSFIIESTNAATQIHEMIERILVIDSDKENGKILPNVRGQIEFREVEFSYPSKPDTPILQGLNLKVQAGKTVGLVGGSGTGKSTIISLLERFYDPIKGDILLDKYKIKRLQLKWLRSQMGLVNQEPILFATSIKENILFGKEEAPMELVIHAAKAANAHDFIIKLPQGYETQVGQFGVQLSGGQKQRIAIARALIRDPRILLLDEATSALDAESERIVQEALDQASQGRTTIIIAHRLSTIRRVVESGSHDELIDMNNGQGGAYSKMVQVQQSTVEKEAFTSSYLQTEDTYYRRSSCMRTPQTPINVRSSMSSPAFPFSSTFSMNLTHSFQMHPFNDHFNSNKKNKDHPPASQWRLLRMNAPEWKQALLGCLGAAGSGTIQAIYAYCLGTVVSIYFKDNSTIKSKTRFYCFIFLGLAVLSFIANLFQHYNFAIMGERLTKRVREKMLEKLLTFEIGWFDEDDNTSAAIYARLATEANMVRSLIAERLSLLVQVFFSASLAFVLGILATWRVAIVMIAMQPLLIASFYSKSVLIKSMPTKVQKAQNEGSQLASEAIINHRTITAFSSQERILSLFEAAMKGPRNESVKASWFYGFGLFTSQFLTTTAIALTFWYGGRLINKKLVSPKHLFQVFFILISTGKSIADAGSMTSDIAKGSSAIRSVFAIIDRHIKKSIKGQIELKKVFFSYPARPEQRIFKGLSLKIEVGKTIALVGQSGSGKSTVIGGSILIEGHDVRSYNLRKLRSHIALVSKEPTLFAGTIRENIAFGTEDAIEYEIRKAAMLANAHEFIRDGYDTNCGERGVQLSGGQKQRIALAQAILKNPKILLLDEAISALDSVSENLVQESLEKMMVGRTCVIVAH